MYDSELERQDFFLLADAFSESVKSMAARCHVNRDDGRSEVEDVVVEAVGRICVPVAP